MSKLKQKEQLLSNIQVNRSAPVNPAPAAHFTQPVSTISKGTAAGVQLPASQQNFYTGSKYTIQAQPAPLQTYPVNEPQAAPAGNQTIEKLYSEIKELKSLISKQQPGQSAMPNAQAMVSGIDPNKDMVRNVLKTNTAPGRK